MRRPFTYLLFFCLSGLLTAAVAKWTEHRRALLVNASDDKEHLEGVEQLEEALQAKGFLVNVIAAYLPWGSAYFITWDDWRPRKVRMAKAFVT